MGARYRSHGKCQPDTCKIDGDVSPQTDRETEINIGIYTHAPTHARARAHTHTHTYICTIYIYIYIILPRQQYPMRMRPVSRQSLFIFIHRLFLTSYVCLLKRHYFVSWDSRPVRNGNATNVGNLAWLNEIVRLRIITVISTIAPSEG